MKILRLIRIAFTKDGTFGVLLDEDVPFCVTTEREWLSNVIGKSCIPDGTYLCQRVDSPKFGNTFQVMNVPGRSEILIHKGNLSSDSKGCIIVGEEFGTLNGRVAVLSSGKAFDEFMSRLKGVVQFKLAITEVKP
jgi:hypothetical protein